MLLVLFMTAAIQATQPVRVSPVPLECDRVAVRAATLSPSEARKLGELPPGVLQLAVDKRVEGCGVTVLPTKDARGNHIMLFDPNAPAVVRRTDGASREKTRPQRER